VAFKEFAGVCEVLIGIGNRRSDTGKHLIEYGYNPLLFGEGGEHYLNPLNKINIQTAYGRTCG